MAPIPAPSTATTPATPSLNAGLYSRYSWPDLAAALAQADHGDGTLLRQFTDDSYGWQPSGRYPPFEDRSFAISALDRRYPRKPKSYWREGRRSFRDFPHFWWWGGYSKLVDGLYPIAPRGVFRGPFRNPASNTATLVIAEAERRSHGTPGERFGTGERLDLVQPDEPRRSVGVVANGPRTLAFRSWSTSFSR